MNNFIRLSDMPGWRSLPAGRLVVKSVMYFVYVLKSEIRKYLYVGITDNIDRRVSEHNSGNNKTTKAYRPFLLIHTEQFSDRRSARIKEKYLKSGIGKEFLKDKYMPGWRNW